MSSESAKNGLPTPEIVNLPVETWVGKEILFFKVQNEADLRSVLARATEMRQKGEIPPKDDFSLDFVGRNGPNPNLPLPEKQDLVDHEARRLARQAERVLYTRQPWSENDKEPYEFEDLKDDREASWIRLETGERVVSEDQVRAEFDPEKPHAIKHPEFQEVVDLLIMGDDDPDIRALAAKELIEIAKENKLRETDDFQNLQRYITGKAAKKEAPSVPEASLAKEDLEKLRKSLEDLNKSMEGLFRASTDPELRETSPEIFKPDYYSSPLYEEYHDFRVEYDKYKSEKEPIKREEIWRRYFLLSEGEIGGAIRGEGIGSLLQGNYQSALYLISRIVQDSLINRDIPNELRVKSAKDYTEDDKKKLHEYENQRKEHLAAWHYLLAWVKMLPSHSFAEASAAVLFLDGDKDTNTLWKEISLTPNEKEETRITTANAVGKLEDIYQGIGTGEPLYNPVTLTPAVKLAAVYKEGREAFVTEHPVQNDPENANANYLAFLARMAHFIGFRHNVWGYKDSGTHYARDLVRPDVKMQGTDGASDWIMDRITYGKIVPAASYVYTGDHSHDPGGGPRMGSKVEIPPQFIKYPPAPFHSFYADYWSWTIFRMNYRLEHVDDWSDRPPLTHEMLASAEYRLTSEGLRKIDWGNHNPRTSNDTDPTLWLRGNDEGYVNQMHGHSDDLPPKIEALYAGELSALSAYTKNPSTGYLAISKIKDSDKFLKHLGARGRSFMAAEFLAYGPLLYLSKPGPELVRIATISGQEFIHKLPILNAQLRDEGFTGRRKDTEKARRLREAIESGVRGRYPDPNQSILQNEYWAASGPIIERNWIDRHIPLTSPNEAIDRQLTIEAFRFDVVRDQERLLQQHVDDTLAGARAISAGWTILGSLGQGAIGMVNGFMKPVKLG